MLENLSQENKFPFTLSFFDKLLFLSLHLYPTPFEKFLRIFTKSLCVQVLIRKVQLSGSVVWGLITRPNSFTQPKRLLVRMRNASEEEETS